MDTCSHPVALHGAHGCRLNGCPCTAEMGMHARPARPQPVQPAVQPSNAWLVPMVTAGSLGLVAVVVLVLSGQVCS